MFSEKLKELRIRKGLTHIEVSKALGIPQTTYSGYENQNREPKYEKLKEIADFYNVSIDYLLEHKEKDTDLIKIIKILNNEQQEKLLEICKTFYPNEYNKIKKTF